MENLVRKFVIFMDNFLKGKKVLVTGATGLVGGHLVHSLLAQGALVYITHRSRDFRSYFFQEGFENKVVCEFCDINDKQRVFDVILNNEIEYVFHLAAQAIVHTAFLNPYDTFLTNILGTVNILEAARHSPFVKAVVVASSDKAYGKDCKDAREDQKLAGDHPYDVSKSAADLVAISYFNSYNLPVSVSRFGNIFGPGDLNFNRIVPGAIRSLLLGEKLEIRSDGKFIRDYVYVKDVVNGYILLAKYIEKTKGQAYNFSTGYNLSVLEIIDKISSVTGQQIQYTILNNQKNEIPSQSLNFEKARSQLGWRSEYTLEGGIKETFSWYKNYFSKTE